MNILSKEVLIGAASLGAGAVAAKVVQNKVVPMVYPSASENVKNLSTVLIGILTPTIVKGNVGTGLGAGMIATYGVSVCGNTPRYAISGNSFYPVGNVGTGLSEAEMDSLSVILKRNVDAYSNGVYYFLPRKVLEITCDAITLNQDGTYGLRFPRIVRIRDDKYPADCNTLDDIRDYCSNI